MQFVKLLFHQIQADKFTLANLFFINCDNKYLKNNFFYLNLYLKSGLTQESSFTTHFVQLWCPGCINFIGINKRR